MAKTPTLSLSRTLAPRRALLAGWIALHLGAAVIPSLQAADPKQGAGLQAEQNLFNTAYTVDLGEGWYWNSLFGFYYGALYPYLYTVEDAEWLYAMGQSEGDGFFFWNFRRQHWGWTATAYYPLFLNLSLNQWAGMRDPATVSGMNLVDAGSIPKFNLDLPSFFIGIYEVTWFQWKEVRTWAFANGYSFTEGQGCRDDHPVHLVSWFDVLKWCNAKSEMEGFEPVYYFNGSVLRSQHLTRGDTSFIEWRRSERGYRLPTRKEWEFAARGGTRTQEFTFSGGNVMDDVGWYASNSIDATCISMWSTHGTWPVGLKTPNELGLYDMSGNVWEWAWDELIVGQLRTAHGGGYANRDFRRGDTLGCEIGSTTHNDTNVQIRGTGFRLAANPEVFLQR